VDDVYAHVGFPDIGALKWCENDDGASTGPALKPIADIYEVGGQGVG